MKIKWAVLASMLMMLLVLPLQAQLRGDGPKTAIIQYNYIIGDNTMELVQYSDNYGNLLCYKYDFNGNPFASIITNDSVFEVNYSMQAYRVYVRPEEDINFNALTPEIIKKYNVESTGTIEFLGKNCTIYTASFKDRDILKVTVWVYRGLELRRVTEYADGRTSDLVATSLEENPEISPETFTIPKGFELFAE